MKKMIQINQYDAECNAISAIRLCLETSNKGHKEQSWLLRGQAIVWENLLLSEGKDLRIVDEEYKEMIEKWNQS